MRPSGDGVEGSPLLWAPTGADDDVHGAEWTPASHGRRQSSSNGDDDHGNGSGGGGERGRRRRVRRADLACLSIVGLVVCFMAIYRPPLRPDSPRWRHYHARHQAEHASPPPSSYAYMTYDAINATQRQRGYRVEYDARGLRIDGRATLLLGGSIHYARSTPGMWRDLLTKAKHDGLNHVQLYVFWNLHEPEPGAFVLRDHANLVAFYDLAAELGLFLHVRFGPYACAEWNNGGLPLWLNDIPGMDVRSSAPAWQREMRRFVRRMVELSRPYFASHGGPIILAQIENEYNGNDDNYVAWCGALVSELNTTIPWVMCNGKAAENTLRACNDNDCVEFARNQSHVRPQEPWLWTEDEGWYQQWAANPEDRHPENPSRPAEEVAYAVARWFAVGGAHHNYYMYHGGNNYGRSAAAGVTTMYADGVNLHADGLSNEPKRSHLRRLHEVLIQCNDVLLRNDRQLQHGFSLGFPNTVAYVYNADDSNERVVFLENGGDQDLIEVPFEGGVYHLAPKSVIIVKGGVILFDTAAVQQSYPHQQRRVYSTLIDQSSLTWEVWTECGRYRKTIVDDRPREQLAITGDRSDYLIYETRLKKFEGGTPSILRFTGCDANSYAVFVDGRFIDDVYLAFPGYNCSRSFTVSIPTTFVRSGGEEALLSIVSGSLGISSLGKNHRKGITGGISLDHVDLSGESHEWRMSPGLIGESLKIYDPEWVHSVPWSRVDKGNMSRPRMSWYRTSFKLVRPQERDTAHIVEDTSSLLVDIGRLTRGRLYLNGQDLGRFWSIKNDHQTKAQQFYHIPFDWLRSDKRENELVVFDELGGDVQDVRIVLSTMVDDLAATVSEILDSTQQHQRSRIAAASTVRRARGIEPES